ncbi:Uncharacterised protein [Escherichia coli]|uniref:Uncharacterized protein n=1 Tax=Escherichia coli TaxID=562 RepID=A0A376VHK8_ECOLX|nr:Uncharacterised protein [Escherichia coli]
MFHAMPNENDYQIHLNGFVVISLIDQDYDYEKIDDLNVMVMFNVSTFT